MDADTTGTEAPKQPSSLEEEWQEINAELSEFGLDLLLVLQPGVPYWPEYRQAVPVLIKHLQRPYSDTTLCGLAGGLMRKIPETEVAWPVALAVWQKLREGTGLRHPGETKPWPFMAKTALANLLVSLYDHRHFETVLALVQDKEQGPTRGFFVRKLTRSKDPRAIAALEDLAGDPACAAEIARYRKARAKREAKKSQAGTTSNP